jgi:sterol desaturase/sphingolipid hydroxylase (fatty acid hydroxylase superfamily)
VEELINNILSDYNYWTLFLLSSLYFLVLYFFLGSIFRWVVSLLCSLKILNKIDKANISSDQIKFEIRNSVVSILIFGLSILPIIFAYRSNVIEFAEDSIFNVILTLIALTFWNEIHFYLVHRLMHQSWFMKHFHYVHHQSTIPTTYSVYSFHWLEAFLLSTVPITLLLITKLSFLGVMLYPIVSILLNFAGHCNYRFGKGKGSGLIYLGTNHHHHHSKRKKNYSFTLSILDRMFSK